MSRRYVLLAYLSFMLAACDDGKDPAGSAGGEETNASTGNLECDPGGLNCTCLNAELCEDGLACEADRCVLPGGDDGDSADDTGSAGDESADDEGSVDECAFDEECTPSEICVFETCTPVDVFSWTVSVTSFVPGGCRDGWGSAELFYRYFEDGVERHQSATDTCPADWSTELLDYDPYLSFEIQFWELDFIYDDFFTTVCWPDENGACGPLPSEVLHARGFIGVDGTETHHFELVVEPVID